MARTDALANEGLDGAVKRAQAYIDGKHEIVSVHTALSALVPSWCRYAIP